MLHCNGIDPFVTLMGNFNWGPISRNDIVSTVHLAQIVDGGGLTVCAYTSALICGAIVIM